MNSHLYEVRPRKDKRGVDLLSDVLPFGQLWYDTPDNAIGYAMHRSRSHDAVIRVYDEAGNVIGTTKLREFTSSRHLSAIFGGSGVKSLSKRGLPPSGSHLRRRIVVLKYVFSLLLGAAFTSCAQTFHKAAPWKEEMAKGYFPYHRLAATDFPVNDHVDPEYGVYTWMFFHYWYNHRWIVQNGHVIDRITKWVVWSGFDRNKSSRKSWFNLDNEALLHEQGHLDINELYSRRLAEMSLDKLPYGEGADPKEASADLIRKVEALADRVSGEAKEEHDRYDAETANGKNLLKQREWSAAIQVRLERAGIHF